MTLPTLLIESKFKETAQPLSKNLGLHNQGTLKLDNLFYKVLEDNESSRQQAALHSEFQKRVGKVIKNIKNINNYDVIIPDCLHYFTAPVQGVTKAVMAIQAFDAQPLHELIASGKVSSHQALGLWKTVLEPTLNEISEKAKVIWYDRSFMNIALDPAAKKIYLYDIDPENTFLINSEKDLDNVRKLYPQFKTYKDYLNHQIQYEFLIRPHQKTGFIPFFKYHLNQAIRNYIAAAPTPTVKQKRIEHYVSGLNLLKFLCKG